MRKFAIFALVLAISTCVQVKIQSTVDLAVESRLRELKKTGWGKVAYGLLEL